MDFGIEKWVMLILLFSFFLISFLKEEKKTTEGIELPN